MPLEIKPSIAKNLPVMVKKTLSDMTTDDQMLFQIEFEKKSVNTVTMVVLSIFFPIQLFLLGKVGLGIVFILTGGGFFIWYLFEIFNTPKRVIEYNGDIATKIITDMKLMSK